MKQEETEKESRITVRLLDTKLADALDRFCRNKRRKPAEVGRSALVEMLEKQGYLNEEG